MKKILLFYLFSLYTIILSASELLVEAESFTNKGGWVVDQQFMDLMGSSYLMAHGMGVPVADAETEVVFPESGKYKVYVRTYNWTSPWYNGKGPGKFTLIVGNRKLSNQLGTEGDKWIWQYAGTVSVKSNLPVKLQLKDLTGFNGRCDAIYFTQNMNPELPTSLTDLYDMRERLLNKSRSSTSAGEYDLVVIGAGIAGMSAAVSAARLGCKVALINDRPVLGGNNSSEIRVHLGGQICVGPYENLGNLQKEFGPTRKGNAQPAEFYEDEKKMEWILKEKNVKLFMNFRAIKVEKYGNSIKTVIAKHIETGDELFFSSPLFVDCTGDGTIGYLAGANYRMGRESKSDFGETTAPEVSDSLTMGASVQWYSIKTDAPAKFPVFEYGLNFNEESSEKVTMGEWTWETGMNFNQIYDFERIRDYGLMVVYSNWSFLKNKYTKKNDYKNRTLGWVAYISGKRESRRLMGDYILKESDIRRYIVHEDATACTSWTIDLHYPDPKNTEYFPNGEFKSIAKHIKIYPYPIPYRCLYSRNVDNLFMAGRNISVTHVALGTVRVMRTAGMMGEVVGMAASLCKKYNVKPRAIYLDYLKELRELMKEGVGNKELPNNQKYNTGASLKKYPVVVE